MTQPANGMWLLEPEENGSGTFQFGEYNETMPGTSAVLKLACDTRTFPSHFRCTLPIWKLLRSWRTMAFQKLWIV